MYASFDPNNLLHWFSFIVVLLTILSFFLAWRKFRLQYKKPKIDILEISAKPTVNNQWGGRESDCFIKFYTFNPSSFGNHFSGKLQRFYFSHSITSKTYRLGRESQTGDYLKLPPFEKILVVMYPRYEKVEKYKHKYLLLTIRDIRGKRIRKWFKFEDYP